MSLSLPIHGRGAPTNPAGRFEPIDFAVDGDYLDSIPEDERPSPRTQLFRDTTRSIIASNDSPDVGFDRSINVYRGCEHGCVYCFARPYHEYLGMSIGIDFETKIFVKHEAPDLLRAGLAKKSWTPQPIGMSGITDCYQPIERKLGLTRRCVEVMVEMRNPVVAITKNHLVTRDIDLFAQLARLNAAFVWLSITTLDAKLAGIMEPRASSPARRLDALRQLSQEGIPCGVLVAPLIPGLTDHELPGLLAAARGAGATACGYVPLRLPYGLKDLFIAWLNEHYPDRKEKVLNAIRAMRGGQLNDSNFETRMRGEGVWAEQVRAIFHLHRRRLGFPESRPPLATEHFRRPAGAQMAFW